MSPHIILRHVSLLILISSGQYSFAQNLAPNPSFENYTQCPHERHGVWYGWAYDWFCPTNGTVDLFNACADGGVVGIPNNEFGYQNAHTGLGYIGMYTRFNSIDYREYVTALLTDTLVAGHWYTVQFYVSRAETGCSTKQIGAFFSAEPPSSPTTDPLMEHPQVFTHYGFLSDTMSWMEVNGCFMANGDELYITIGNYQYDVDNPYEFGCSETGSFSYYYIDDVSVTESAPPTSGTFDMNGPVSACFSYEIVPPETGLYYTWSNNTFEPTLVVDQSGTYYLTITDGCNISTGSIDVEITPPKDTIDIGPEAITLCDGETFAISIDPSLGEITWDNGSSASEYSLSEAGTYSVTVDDGCTITSDTITVFISYPPDPFSLGEDVHICFDEEIELTLDPALGDFLWQDMSTNSSYTILHGGAYSLTISNECGEETDEMVVTDVFEPEIDLGENVRTLCYGDSLHIAFDAGLGDFLWQDGSTDAEYWIDAPGNYHVYVANECGSATDQVQVLFFDAPQFDLGQDIKLCDGDSLLLDGHGITGVYQWQDSSALSQYVVTSAGVYALTITTGCGSAADSIAVSYENPIEAPALGPDFSLCPGDTVMLHVSSGGAMVQWQDMSAGDSLLITTGGLYAVHVFNQCVSMTDTILITENTTPPQLSLPSSLSLCQGQTLVLDPGVVGVDFLWSDISTSDTLLVTSPGAYSLTISNACGSDQDTVVVTNGGAPPTIALGNDVELCPGETFTIAPQGVDVMHWLWSDGSTDTTFTIAGSETVSVQVSNACGTAYDTLIASLLLATPPLDLGSDTSLCAQQFFEVHITTPGVDIAWSDGTSDTTLLIDTPGNYFATISNSCGENHDTIHVGALPSVPLLDLGLNQSLCPGEMIVLSPGIEDVEYVWQDGSTDTVYQSTQADTIILTISNVCGTSTDTLEIVESTQGPDVSLGPDIEACEGVTVTLVSNIFGVDYEWQDGSTLSEYVTTQSGTFILEVSNNCGVDIDTVLVDIHGTPPVIALGPDTLLCDDAVLTLHAGTDAETDVEWQDGSTGESFVLSASGVYYLTATNRCGEAKDTISISALQSPEPFTLGQDTALCPQESIVLQVPNTNDAWQWQDGFAAPVRNVDEEGVYGLVISNVCGVVSDSIVVSVDNRIPVIDIDPSILWCVDDTITLDATQAFGAGYLWSTGATSSTITVHELGSFHVEVTAPCLTTGADIDIEPDPDCFIQSGIYIPNIFSPNGDGINDVFSIHPGSTITMISMEGTIYDRWGNVVFASTALPFIWDGRFNGEAMLPGVYVYRVMCKYEVVGNLYEEVFTGDVSVVR